MTRCQWMVVIKYNMTIKPLSQRDPAWASEKLGTSNTTISSHGCTITCLAMAADITPHEVNERMKAAGAYSDGNLVNWTKIQAAIPWLQFEWRNKGYTDADNARVKAAIDKNGFCLVCVDINPGDGVLRDDHWVNYIGGGKILDPIDGKTKATSTYVATGFSIIHRVGEPPTSGDNQSPWLANSDKWRGLCFYLEMPKDPETTLLDEVKSVIAGFKSRVTDLTKQLTSAVSDKENREDQVIRLKKQLLDEETLATERYTALSKQLELAQKSVAPLEGRIETLQGQVDVASKRLGTANTLIAELESENKILKEKGVGSLSSGDLFSLAFKKLFRIS